VAIDVDGKQRLARHPSGASPVLNWGKGRKDWASVAVTGKPA
jgi:hypothetical protein